MTEDGTFTDISGRASFSHQATDNEVEAYMNPEFMFGKLSDIESSTTLRYFAAVPLHATLI